MSEGAVFAEEIHAVADGADGDEVEKPFLLPYWEAGKFGLEGADELEGDGDAGEVLRDFWFLGLRGFGLRLFGVDEGEGFWDFAFDFVMVGDDGVDVEAGNFVDDDCVGATAVDGDEEVGFEGFEAVGDVWREAVAVDEAVGKDEVEVGEAEVFEGGDKECGGGDAVDVIVAVDCDDFLIGMSCDEAVNGGLHIGEEKGVDCGVVIGMEKRI